MNSHIKGQFITLRPATFEDRKPIYEWLTNSDSTPFVMGPPDFLDHPIPTWEEFIDDYKDYFFDGSQPTLGRCFVIQVDNNAIGQINHDKIHPEDHSTEIDIWLSDGKHTNKGYGTDALSTLCDYLHQKFGCKKFIIAPSRRNSRAVKSYQKAGFQETTSIPPDFSPDYDDTVVMMKRID